MLLEIALLFIFLYQPSEYQVFCSGLLWSLRKCYCQCNHPRVCPDRIVDHIALIILLCPYC